MGLYLVFFFIRSCEKGFYQTWYALSGRQCVKYVVGGVSILISRLTGSAVSAKAFRSSTDTSQISAIVMQLGNRFYSLSQGANGHLSNSRAVISFQGFGFRRALRRRFIYAKGSSLQVIIVIVRPLCSDARNFAFAMGVDQSLFYFQRRRLVALIVRRRSLLLPCLMGVNYSSVTSFVLVLDGRAIFLRFGCF